MKTYKDFLNEQLKLGSKERVHNCKDEEIKFKKYQQVRGAKPQGFWYGFGDSWMKWVRREMPEWEFENYFKVEVDKNKILILDTIKKAEEFTEQYSDDPFSIEWSEVSKEYSGIEIPDYNEVSKFQWMSTWDVSSGCIWDKNAIKKIRKINK